MAQVEQEEQVQQESGYMEVLEEQEAKEVMKMLVLEQEAQVEQAAQIQAGVVGVVEELLLTWVEEQEGQEVLEAVM
jgi:hypothetical protein